jgi:hypothetical protein
VVTALLTILALINSSTKEGTETSKGNFVFPRTLPGGYQVVNVKTGEEAIRDMAYIHWSPERVSIAISDAAIVMYSDGTRLWLSYAGDYACELVNRMAEKMAAYESKLPFTRPILHNLGSYDVYLSRGLHDGKLHAFWCQKGIVVWVEISRKALSTVDPGVLLQALMESIRYKR